jgi:two-component system cell cycle sensor histidine kinase/response regulator CckA
MAESGLRKVDGNKEVLSEAIDYLDYAPAGFFSVDQWGRIGYLNATLAEWLDLRQIGSRGIKLSDIVVGDTVPLLSAFAAGTGDRNIKVLDLDLKTRDGKILPVRLYHKIAFADDGTPRSSRTLVLNRAEDDGIEARRATEMRFVRFFQDTPLAIATIDKSGLIVRANALAAQLFGDPSEGRSILDVVGVLDRTAVKNAVAAAIRGQADIAPIDAALARVNDKTRNFVLADENDRWARFYVTPISDVSAEREAAIVYALDTTDQRRLQDDLSQAQKMESIGELTSGIAHDFKNLVNIILLATDFLLTTHRPTDPSFQDIMQIKNTANRAAGLVQQLLAFARKQTLVPQVLDVGEALSEFAVMVRRMIGERVTLDVVRSPDLWPVKVDANQFQQVILNLVVNAGHAMPDGGKLTIRTAKVTAEEARSLTYKGMPAADYVLVEVADTGSGIAPQDMEKIFLPFFSTKEVGQGTGLGLATVYGIVKQTGGFVYPESELGKGATFRIFLPRFVVDTDNDVRPPAALAVPRAPAAHPSQGTTVTLYEEMLQRIATLEETLRRLDAEPPGIGHNHPPEPIEPFGYEQRVTVVEAIELLRAQPTESKKVKEAAGRLKKIGEKIGAFSATQADSFISEASKSAGAEAGKWLIRLGLLKAVAIALAGVAAAAYALLHSLPPPVH